MFTAQAPDDWTPDSVVLPAALPVLLAGFVRTPRHTGPERVVDTTQVHFYTYRKVSK